MPNIGSNNPFRNSFTAAAEDEKDNTPTRSLPPPSQPLRRSPSTTTTIMEEDENEPSSQRQVGGMIARSTSSSPVPPPTPPPTGPLPAIPQSDLEAPQTAYIIDGNKSKSPSTANGTDGHILITIQSTDSAASTPPHTGTLPTHRLSMDPVQHRCTMWPALRLAQKSRIKSKRTWTIIKVIIALVIIVGAVAVGLGISKAVNNAKRE